MGCQWEFKLVQPLWASLSNSTKNSTTIKSSCNSPWSVPKRIRVPQTCKCMCIYSSIVYSSQAIDSALLSIYRWTDDVNGIPLYNGSLFSREEINFVISRKEIEQYSGKEESCNFDHLQSLILCLLQFSLYLCIYLSMCINVYINIHIQQRMPGSSWQWKGRRGKEVDPWVGNGTKQTDRTC